MKVSYYSLGCKVNEYEAIAIINQFIDHNYELVDFEEEADIYIINSCTVTSTSDAKSRKIIRQAKRRNPEAVIAVMGCYSQLNPEIVKEIGADIVLGTSNRHLLFNLVEEALQTKKKKVLVEDSKNERAYEEIKIRRYLNHTRGFIKIEDGCDNFCSYCAIPYARGRVRSREVDAIIKEIQELSKQGMKEVVLSGINTGSYGKDLDDFSFADLLREIVTKTDIYRIRISSLEVTEINDQVLKVFEDYSNRFCQHFHIPLQNGSAEVLKMMNRKYNSDFYYQKIEEIRKLFPNVNITTDYLAGFPGETQEMFLEGLEFVKKMKFGEMHVFPYSRRPNTKAANFPNHLDEVTKRFRVNELLNISRENALLYRQKFQNQDLEVLVETIENGFANGHTSNYIQVRFPAISVKTNDLVMVNLEKIDYPISFGRERRNV